METEPTRVRAQEVTLRCQYEGCTSFAPIKSGDSKELPHLVKLLDIHTQTVHGSSLNEDNSRGEERESLRLAKESRALQAALSSRIVTKTLDDANFNLCEARFYTFPLNMKVLGQNMPVSAYPVNTVVDLSYLGVDVTNPELLKKMHNRANATIRLKDFSDTNLRGYHSSNEELVAIQAKFDQNQLKLGRHQKELSSAQEAVKAFSNFMVLSRNFHPLDTSQMALQRVVLEKYFSGPPTVTNYSNFFEKFVHASSVRAHMKAVPLSYKEILDIWNTYIDPPAASKLNIEKMLDEKIKRLSTEMGMNKSKGSPSKKQKRSGPPYCPYWNVSPTPPFCSNKQIVGGCIDSSGTEYVHSCSFRLQKGTCGSKNHNKLTH